MKKIAQFLLKILGWTIEGELPIGDKAILAGAPHTSAQDMFISLIGYTALGGKSSFLIKSDYFFFPVGNVLRMMGGVPVNRSKGSNIVKQSINEFEKRDKFHLAITPEGTRKATKRWKAGYHAIARMANVPVYLCYFDFKRKAIRFDIPFELTDDSKADTLRMQEAYYKMGVTGRYPNQFLTGFEE